ncbi:hypothetical protein EK21DRAFT_115802 [Setomelanomma holmii]|uniref:Uncharacterized protein n=1 Tax=Setomelanomma holmii TaxID=210430 RepID=A0A9P4H3Q2_9PLEO|nr:hypothetical protein EK21DRAFT_115802 [Setomelanomma holmii]
MLPTKRKLECIGYAQPGQETLQQDQSQLSVPPRRDQHARWHAALAPEAFQDLFRHSDKQLLHDRALASSARRAVAPLAGKDRYFGQQHVSRQPRLPLSFSRFAEEHRVRNCESAKTSSPPQEPDLEADASTSSQEISDVEEPASPSAFFQELYEIDRPNIFSLPEGEFKSDSLEVADPFGVPQAEADLVAANTSSQPRRDSGMGVANPFSLPRGKKTGDKGVYTSAASRHVFMGARGGCMRNF